MSVQEEQTKKFIVDTPRGAEDGSREADIVIISPCTVPSLPPYPVGFLPRAADVCTACRAAEAPPRSCVIARSKVKVMAAPFY